MLPAAAIWSIAFTCGPPRPLQPVLRPLHTPLSVLPPASGWLRPHVALSRGRPLVLAWDATALISTAAAQDAGVALTLAALAKVWVQLWGSLASSGAMPSTLTRKLIHAGTGPLFVLGWPFFSDSPRAVWAACAVPALNLVRLFLAGKDGGSSDEAVAALSRTGAPSEVRKGPFYYTAVLLAATALSFRALPGVIAVCQMAVGDGLADIVGRRLGKTPWGIVENKTVEGSLAFVAGAFTASLAMLSGCHALGYTTYTASAALAPLLAISVACASVELLSAPLRCAVGEWGDDNLTVPAVAAALTALLLR